MSAGDTGFMMICAALVFFMTPGLAFFYGGLSRRKNVINTMLMCFGAIGLVGVLWIVAGWSLAQGWLLWSLGLYVFAGLCWLPVVWLQIRVRDMAEAALREARPIEPLAYRYMNAWFILGWPAFIAFMVIFYLMVNKPV